MPDDPALAPVRKLDPHQLVPEVNAHAQAGLEFRGRAADGEVGAAYVRWPDGHDGVLTWAHSPIADLHRTASMLETARAHGLPVPRYELLAELPDGIGVVQERLPGAPPATIDRPLLDAMIALNERFEGVLAGHTDVPPPEMYLLQSGPGFCIHESLARYSDRTRRLLGWVREVGSESAEMRGDDLVHLDYHSGNVLTDAAGRITGIVDWDGIGRGDRRFALVTLRFDAFWHLQAADLSWFDRLLEASLGAPALRSYWAHMSLRQVDWAIRHYGTAEVERWLGLAETRMA